MKLLTDRPGSAMILVMLCLTANVFAVPKSEPWPRWQANDPLSTVSVDHGPWSRFLELHLVSGKPGEVSTVAYSRVPAADRQRLGDYIASLERAKVSTLNRDEQFAYWVNLYNAGTVRLILDKYPVKSIRDIKLGGLFSSGPWDAKLFTVEGEPLSLNDVEHRILRPIWKDPRIHYAVNCASVSCPNLQGTAFTAANHGALLEQSARSYINSARGVDLSSGTLVLSSIYSWFADDFGPGQAALLSHLRRYAEPALAERLAGYRGRITFGYDWSLNEAHP